MRLSGRSGIVRQVEPEGGAATVAVQEADVTVHHLDQALANGEPEPGAALLPRRGGVGLVKAAEDARPERLGDAGPAVVHADPQAVRRLLGADLDHFALG